jgi:hypothetical protein
MARKENITIICFPGHTTHLLQPLDVSVYSSVKKEWRKIIKNHFEESNFRSVDKSDFAELFAKLVNSNKAFCRRHIVAGFESTGIFPFNPTAFDRSKLNFKIVDSLTLNACNEPARLIQTQVSSSNGPTRFIQTQISEPNGLASKVLSGSISCEAESSKDVECFQTVEPIDSVNFLESDLESVYSVEYDLEVDSENDSGIDMSFESSEEDLQINQKRPNQSTKASMKKTKYEEPKATASLKNVVNDFLKEKYSIKEKPTTKRTRILRPNAECITEQDVLQRLENKRR